MTISPAIKDWDEWKTHVLSEPECAIPSDLPGRWIVAHTRPRNEKALAKQLRTSGIFFYLPLAVNITRSLRSRRTSQSLVSVFPSYVFVNCNESQRLSALQTNRIVKTLPVSNQSQFVNELRHVHRVIMTGTPFDLNPTLKVGSWARVVSGPLSGMEGVVLQELSRTRLALNVNMLSQAIVLEVGRELLEMIDEPTRPDKAP